MINAIFWVGVGVVIGVFLNQVWRDRIKGWLQSLFERLRAKLDR